MSEEQEDQFLKKVLATLDRASRNYEFRGIQKDKLLANFVSTKTGKHYLWAYTFRHSDGKEPDCIELKTTRKEPLYLEIK